MALFFNHLFESINFMLDLFVSSFVIVIHNVLLSLSRGSVIGPTFHFNIPKLKFGVVSYGKF